MRGRAELIRPSGSNHGPLIAPAAWDVGASELLQRKPGWLPAIADQRLEAATANGESVIERPARIAHCRTTHHARGIPVRTRPLGSIH
jgi:hypothetical protein